MKAAIVAMKQKGAGKICVAIPVVPIGTVKEIEAQADEDVCLHAAKPFFGVGA